jgi:hypothetical protein
MDFSKCSQSILERARQVVVTAHALVPHARSASRKPAAVGYILLTAHRAQITLGILLVFLILIAPAAVDFVTGAVFPPETSKKVFGLLKTHHESPWKDASYVAVMTVLWLASIVSTLLLVWFNIPRGLARANARARALLAAGDSQSDIVKRRALYSRALALVTDPNLESELETRLRKGASSFITSSSAGAVRAGDGMIDRDTLINACESTSQGEVSPLQSALDDRYTLGPELGKGAMGIVFRAWDKVLDRKVAVKQLSRVLSGDDEYTSRFRREAKALARLTHPNVVQVFDLVEDGSRLWMVLEYVDGGDLASYLKESGRLSVSEAASIVMPVADGLAFAHDQGIVHRDLKPANVLLTGERVPKISDFGIAKLSQSSELTQLGSVLGSPPYMSPEQCSGGSVDARTDIYALGITLYELLSGQVPFEGETSSVLARQIVEQPLPLSEVLESISPEVEDLVLRMLAKNPDERPSDMTEVIDMLSNFGDESPVSRRSQLSYNKV